VGVPLSFAKGAKFKEIIVCYVNIKMEFLFAGIFNHAMRGLNCHHAFNFLETFSW
jgi:hypothetical protein